MHLRGKITLDSKNGTGDDSGVMDHDLLTFFLEHLAGRFDRRKEILDAEWSLGNGQCPICYGLRPGGRWASDITGHRGECLFEVVVRAIRAGAPLALDVNKQVGLLH